MKFEHVILHIRNVKVAGAGTYDALDVGRRDSQYDRLARVVRLRVSDIQHAVPDVGLDERQNIVVTLNLQAQRLLTIDYDFVRAVRLDRFERGDVSHFSFAHAGPFDAVHVHTPGERQQTTCQ